MLVVSGEAIKPAAGVRLMPHCCFEQPECQTPRLLLVPRLVGPKLLLAIVSIVLLSPPGSAQRNGADYQRRYPQGRGAYQSEPGSAPSATSPYDEPSSQLPDSSTKGVRQRSHWLDRPNGSSNIVGLSKQVDDLLAKHMSAKAKNDRPGAAQANAAMQNLLRQLVSMEPREAKWHVLKATTYINQAGGPSRSGTAGDRFSLQQAIRELDLAAACPNASQYRNQITSIRGNTEQELKRRVAKGLEIQRRGARQFAEIYGMPGGESRTDYGPTLCTVCGHSHRSGECTYRRD